MKNAIRKKEPNILYIKKSRCPESIEFITADYFVQLMNFTIKTKLILMDIIYKR
jgi:hypothetical protein